jgi:hypothetical protein
VRIKKRTYVVVHATKHTYRVGVVFATAGVPVVEFISGPHSKALALEVCREWQKSANLVKLKTEERP